MLMASLVINAQRKSESYDWNKVINAIAMVESKGNVNARNGIYCGPLQISPVLVPVISELLN